MTDRIGKLREKAELLEIDDPGVVQDLVDVALTYTDEDVERAARQMVQDNTINWPEWDRLPEDTQEFWKRIATTAFESFGARRAE